MRTDRRSPATILAVRARPGANSSTCAAPEDHAKRQGATSDNTFCTRIPVSTKTISIGVRMNHVCTAPHFGSHSPSSGPIRVLPMSPRNRELNDVAASTAEAIGASQQITVARGILLLDLKSG